MAAHQAPPSLGFCRQEHWSGLPFPSPMQETEKWKWGRSAVSDSSQPHGLKPTRLPHPWDFPGKSTGVGCHCLLRHKLCYRLYFPKMVMTVFPIPLTRIQCDSLKVESVSPPLESGWASELQPNKSSGSDTTWLPRLAQKRRPSFPPCYLENLDWEPRAMIQEI